MLKNILNLKGAQKLTIIEQKEINGGKPEGCSATFTYIASSLEECSDACLMLRFNETTGVCVILQYRT